MAERPDAGDRDVLLTLGMGDGARNNRRWLWLVVTVLAVAALGFGVRHWLAERALAMRPRYEQGKVVRGDIQVVVSATGTLNGRSTVEVGAEVTGRVTEVLVDYNARITKGQLLAVIDPERSQMAVDESTARVREAEANIRQARATLLESRQTRERAAREAKDGLLSQKDLEASEAALERAEATLLSAEATATVSKATLGSQRSTLQKTRILSPIDGIVLARSVEPGQTITAGFSTPVLFKLTEDLRRMELLVYVDEADIGRVREGMAASFTVDAYSEKTFPSKVLSLRNEPHEEDNVVTYEAVLEVNNDELLLRPGMTATATIVSDVRHGVLGVPNAALRFAPAQLEPSQIAKPGEHRVWALRGDKPEPIPVKTGVSDGRLTEIREGALKEGQELVTDAILPAAASSGFGPPGGRK
ncbi:MAG TPA: efflux RND transporter periplasmic adaptor subunit [Polyangiales bacterium]|nr:efflux RND transporter periplasmic adaptor subunit [Polyangiales bacterium]